MQVIVFGGSGFVGGAVVLALKSRGIDAVIAKAPRLPHTTQYVPDNYRAVPPEFATVVEQCRKAEVVINAAGIARPGDFRESELIAANAVLPGLLAQAAHQAGVKRFIHVSSAAVQGRLSCLTAAPAVRGFSPYSWSKVLGERAVLEHGQSIAVVHRPAGVHAAEREVTRRLARFAASRLSSVGGSGDRPTPQALVRNVGEALAFLAVTKATPPLITTQPSEGLTTGRLLAALGGRQPHSIPTAVARGIVKGATCAARPAAALQAHARRLELLWLGQAQSTSWLTLQGWRPPLPIEGWHQLGRQLRHFEPAKSNRPNTG